MAGGYQDGCLAQNSFFSHHTWTQDMSCHVPVKHPHQEEQVHPQTLLGCALLMVVHPLVLDELGALAKSLATGATGKGLLTRVSP